MKIAEILNLNSISLKSKISKKEDIINLALDLANKSGKINNFEIAKSEVFKREAIMSTGIGNGIALPHAKTNAVDSLIGAFITLENPTNFVSLDDSKVSMVFLLLGQDSNVGIHLRLLSKISRYLNNDLFKSQLLALETPEEVLDLFNKYESELS